MRELYPELQPIGLLCNLVVAPDARRRGLARELCRWCEEGCAQWHIPALALQVEQANLAGCATYDALGFEELWRDDDATALRLSPGEGSTANELLLLDSLSDLRLDPAPS